MIIRTITYSLLITILTISTSQFTTFIAFKLNQQYIAQNLCVNRNHPEKKCKGTCHLKQELKKTEQEDQKQNAPQWVLKDFLFYFQPINTYHGSMMNSTANLKFGFTPYFVKSEFYYNIFQPPRFSV